MSNIPTEPDADQLADAEGAPTASFYKQFFDEAPDMFASVDPKSARIIACNLTLCRNLGYSREEILGKPLHFLYHPDCISDVDQIFQTFIARGVAESPHLVLIKADGSSMDVSLRISSHRDQNGQIVASRSIFRDITSELQVKQLQLELRLQDAQKMEGLALLAGGIAHDFNNLLVSILGNASLGILELPKESPVREKFLSIETAAQRAADLTKQLLAYSGAGNHEQSNFDLSKIVEEMGHLMSVAISRKVVLNFDLTDEPVPILGDITQVRQIIMNLITNGSDAIGDRSGMITIRTGLHSASREYLNSSLIGSDLDPGYYGFLELSDTGTGISAEDQKRMFDPFFTTKTKGHGLGLAAVLGIVRGHLGTLRVYSEIGKGTTIRILLPAADYAPESLADFQDLRQGHGERILLVDDEEHVRATSRQILQHFGFEVILCSDGREAVEYYKAHSSAIELVLMDITMPHMDGISAYKTLSDFDPGVRVVLMSGYTEKQATSALIGRSFSGFLQKPFTPASLLRAIGSAMNDPHNH